MVVVGLLEFGMVWLVLVGMLVLDGCCWREVLVGVGCECGVCEIVCVGLECVLWMEVGLWWFDGVMDVCCVVIVSVFVG